MTVDEILKPMIEEELKRYEELGNNIKLKSVRSLRRRYTVTALIALVVLFPLLFITIPVYIYKMKRLSDKAEVILTLAKKSPDKTIPQLIAEEIAE